MKISVLIPCYNSAKTIEATLASVMAQSLPPDEVVLLLDGGTDDTESRVAKYGARIRLLKQSNLGVACARNRLAVEARGDILAFLDSDDLWHPKYLEVQRQLLSKHPDAVSSFTGHVRFESEDYEWMQPPEFKTGLTELLDPVTFFTDYNINTAVFGSMSYCCVTKRAIEQLGKEPFSTDLHAVEDSFLCYQLALLGPVVFNPGLLVAYRLTNGSLSENRIRNLGRWVSAFQRLEKRYLDHKSVRLAAAFSYFYAQKRREYAKVLMGAGRVKEARIQLCQSIRNCQAPMSILKSLTWLILGGLPRSMQPAYPSSVRKHQTSNGLAPMNENDGGRSPA